MTPMPRRQMKVRNVAPQQWWCKVKASHGGGVHDVECGNCGHVFRVHSSQLPDQCPGCKKDIRFVSDTRLASF